MDNSLSNRNRLSKNYENLIIFSKTVIFKIETKPAAVKV